MTKVLVTGGAGFIGSHLCEYLLDKGEHVVCVDNYFTGSKKNIEHLIGKDNFEIVEHDIIEPLYVDVDQIYNLACPASPIHYQKNKVRTIKMGTVAMVNMLGIAKRTGARILQASTSEIYGDPKVHPQREEYWGNVNPIGPRACYDEGKRVAESLNMAYYWECGVDIRIARIFNTYGPRMAKEDGRVVSNLIMQALTNQPLTIYGTGEQTRSFCFISDMIEGLYKLMNYKEFVGPVNLGNPRQSTILELATLIQKLVRVEGELIKKPLPEDDPVRRSPDITRAKKYLDWSPTVTLEEGLKETIEYFKSVV
ncbi:MAG: SDR family oxidoreductase [Thermoplasmata archaeon]|nr:MAG: SDR family oxidoreductase [Thermoplasmata archaeon]